MTAQPAEEAVFKRYYFLLRVSGMCCLYNKHLPFVFTLGCKSHLNAKLELPALVQGGGCEADTALSTGVPEDDRPHAGADDSGTAGACLARGEAFATATQLPRGGNGCTHVFAVSVPTL